MSAGNSVTLVSPDPASDAFRGRLEKALWREVVACTPEGVRGQLGPSTPGCLLLAAAAPADVEPIRLLVQEVRLRQWPLRLFLVASEEVAAGPAGAALTALEPYVEGRWTWPADASRLARRLTECPARGGPAPTPADPNSSLTAPAVEDAIARQLGCHTPSLAPLADRLALVAVHDITVRLTGETGTGKTHLARIIHEYSPRKAERLMVIPCGALASNLIESELFGHVKGAFTGADRPKVGKFEAVGKGTLLLDEVDALGLEQQAKLLRVIETGAYEPVGSNETKLCQARIIAASNWNLEQAVAEGKFRQDLYYRLNVLSFYLPPLRERAEDIRMLARGMVAYFSKKFKKELFAIQPDVLWALEEFSWPGNIRQLENVIHQSVLMSSGLELTRQHLPQLVRDATAPARANGALPAPVAAAAGSLAQHREEQERYAIQRALAESNNCRNRAASALGISRITLYNKMRKYGLLS